MLKLLATVALFVLLSDPTFGDVTGKPRVIDGDTLEIAGKSIRLFGIDAPEMAHAQRCVGQNLSASAVNLWLMHLS
jgi:endonuclease YncB( thermonuclease family)